MANLGTNKTRNPPLQSELGFSASKSALIPYIVHSKESSRFLQFVVYLQLEDPHLVQLI